MSEAEKRGSFRGRNYRRRAVEPKAEFPEAAYHEGALTPKHIGFLYAHHRLTVADIVNRYPNRLNHAQVHLALYHYYSKRAEFDAELKRETKFNRNDALKDASMSLPSVGLASLVHTEEMHQVVCEAERLRK